MADYVKAKIAEKNGVELAFAEEYMLIPENFPFVDPGFDATDTHEAIVEAKSTGTPGPEGPAGPPGQDALRFEQNVIADANPVVVHNFGKVPVDIAMDVSISYADRKYNTFRFNKARFGTGVTVAGLPTKIDPSTYTRVDSSDFNSCTFTFTGPVTGRIILLA